MNIEVIIKNGISHAFQELYNHNLPAEFIELQPTKKEFEGSITFVAFTYSKISKQSPEATANSIGEYLKQHTKEVNAYNVVKGFLNISIADLAWLTIFREEILKKDFSVFAGNGCKVMVEYSSPNTNKPLHLGHLRNNFLGYSVAEILKASGYDVIKANLVNDRGIHICKSMLAYQKQGKGETPQSAGIKGDHLIGKYYVLFDKLYKQEIEELQKNGVEKEKAEKEAAIMKEAQQKLLHLL